MEAKANITEELEAMIDRHGLLRVLTGLELICLEKADHIRENWRDAITAKSWDRDAARISAILDKITN